MKPKLCLFLTLLIFPISILLLAQQSPSPPHVSAITPPPIPAVLPHLRRWPTNTMLLHVPPGKTAEMFYIGNMQMDELLERVRTNRYHLYLIEFRDAPLIPLRTIQVTPAEEDALKSYREGIPQHP